MFTVKYLYEENENVVKYNTYEEAHDQAIYLWFMNFCIGYEIYNEEGKCIEIS